MTSPELLSLAERYGSSVSDLDEATVAKINDVLDRSFRQMEERLRVEFQRMGVEATFLDRQSQLYVQQQLGDLLTSISPETQAEIEAILRESYITANQAGVTMGDVLTEAVIGDQRELIEAVSTIPIEAIAMQARDGASRLYRYGQEQASRLSTIVQMGLAQRQSWVTVSQALRQELGGTRYQAERIARTESMSALNDAAQRRYRENGLFVQVMATRDELTCPLCHARNGNVYNTGSVRVPFHPNCRCVVLPWSQELDELGLNDNEFVEQYHREGLARLEAEGLQPDYGASPFEKMNGQPAPVPIRTPIQQPDASI